MRISDWSSDVCSSDLAFPARPELVEGPFFSSRRTGLRQAQPERIWGWPVSLHDKDRIFTNLYGFQPWNLKSAQARGDWDDTKDLMKRGQDEHKLGSANV